MSVNHKTKICRRPDILSSADYRAAY